MEFLSRKLDVGQPLPIGRAVYLLAGKSPIKKGNPPPGLAVVTHGLAPHDASYRIKPPGIEGIDGGRCSELPAGGQPDKRRLPQPPHNAGLHPQENLSLSAQEEESLAVQ